MIPGQITEQDEAKGRHIWCIIDKGSVFYIEKITLKEWSKDQIRAWMDHVNRQGAVFSNYLHAHAYIQKMYKTKKRCIIHGESSLK